MGLAQNKESEIVKLSIVTTLYKSAGTIKEFYRRAMAAAEPLGYEVELIMVNDGSPDESLNLALTLHRADARVVIVDLARNFGHHKAMMTGLTYASGELVFLIDSDLDEEPELLASFHERLAKGDCDVVYGFQERRRGGLLEKVGGEAYYFLLGLLSDEKPPRNILTARLMTLDYVRALVRHRDRAFLISQLWTTSGFKQVGLPARKLSNPTTTYSLRVRAEYFLKHITTTSTKLLYIIFWAGFMSSCLAVAVIGYYLFRYAFFGIGVDGFTSLIVSIWFFGGLLTLILGIQGIYIANILSETKRRPYTVVREVYDAERARTASSNIIRAPLSGVRNEANRTR
jgi:putative glycosyltransferase